MTGRNGLTPSSNDMDISSWTKTVRTLVDIGDTQVKALDELSKEEKRSGAALIRQAIDDYLAKRYGHQQGDAFGLWGKCFDVSEKCAEQP